MDPIQQIEGSMYNCNFLEKIERQQNYVHISTVGTGDVSQLQTKQQQLLLQH